MSDAMLLEEIRDLRTRLAALERLEAPQYVTGTFTPTFGGSGGDGTWTYTAQVGRYTRVGNRVLFQLTVAPATRTVAATGDARIRGLPFTSLNLANSQCALAIDTLQNVALLAGTRVLTARVIPNSAAIELVESPSGGAATILPASSWLATTVIRIAGHYEV